MKLKNYLLIIFLVFVGIFHSNAQNKSTKSADTAKSEQNDFARNPLANVPFVARIPGFPGNSVNVKGDVVFVGNHILGATNDPGNSTAAFPAIVPSYASGTTTINNLPALTAKANFNNNSNSSNDALNFEYIDVDSDASTFQSSTANLALKNLNNTTNDCKTIAYAGLYWSAMCQYDRFPQTRGGIDYPAIPSGSDWNKIKFKVPGGSYVDITADTAADTPGDEDEIILSLYSTLTPNPVLNDIPGNPYVCYKNVTNLIKPLLDANGTYAVANMRAARGKVGNSSGAGWTLVIIYETQAAPSKYITIFDGYQQVNPAETVYYDITGFQTVTTGPVRAKIGIATLEGDQEIINDEVAIKSPSSLPIETGPYTLINNSLNPAADTFNSSISSISNTPVPIPFLVTTRLPNGTNTLGFDLDVMEIPNNSNATIANNAKTATLRLTSGGDRYGAFLNTFAIDIIEPAIILTKLVKDNVTGAEIGNTAVALGAVLNYEISYQNIGNDDAEFFKIVDVLPANVLFNIADVTLPAGVPAPTYNPITRELIFTIPNNQVTASSTSPRTINIRVTVDPNPLAFINACTNTIKNEAFASYVGVISDIIVNERVSFNYYSATNCYTTPAGSTNFITNQGTSTFIKNEVLCGSSFTLTAPTGYRAYSWTNTTTGATVIGTGNTLIVSAVGTYIVYCDIGSPCTPAYVNFVVTLFDANSTNPMIPYSSVVPLPICTSNFAPMPIIILCGSETKLVNLNIGTATGIKMERLTESSCPTNLFPNCAIANPPTPALPCAWTVVPPTSALNPSQYLIIDAGQYRMDITYPGGCKRTFYFTVYKNNLTPTVTIRNIGCNVTGQITVNQVPAGYEYQLEKSAGGVDKPYQTSNVFVPVAAGDYIVKVRLLGATPTDCVFPVTARIENFGNIVMTVTPTKILCQGGTFNIKVDINGVIPDYTFKLYFGASAIGTPAATSGPNSSYTHTFTNQVVNPVTHTSTYTVVGIAGNGCIATQTITVTEPAKLTLDAAITTPITCKAGLITFLPNGGSGNYSYSVNGTLWPNDVLTVPVPVPNTGPIITTTYVIKVADYNGCNAETTIAIASHPEPEHTIVPTVIKCFGATDGTIKFDLTANLGDYILAYSINNGVSYQASNIFNNLAAGDYDCIVRYTLQGEPSCFKTKVVVRVVQPILGLTASAGVSKLACSGPGNTVINGTVRITNPQGGTPFSPGAPYKYYFNGYPGVASTNVPTFQADFAPGTYVIYIQDASGCAYPMTVTIDPPITAPTISVAAPVFNCNGTATATVTVNNGGGNFAYTYSLDSVLNTTIPTNVFNNVPCGAHTVRVNYKATNIPTYYNLLNETFGSGLNTTTPGIAAAYCWNYQPAAPIPPVVCPRLPLQPNYASYLLDDNQYVVTKAIIPNNGNWFPYRDHTSAAGPIDPNGRFLAINIGKAAGANGILYSQTINNILPNQPVKVELYVANLLKVGSTFVDPSFILELVDSAGNTIGGPAGQVSTGIIDNNPTVPPDPSYVANGWRFKQITLNPGNNTTLKFNIRSGSVEYIGNDAGIDDIRVFQEPISCDGFIDYPINVECGKVFTASITSSTNVKCKGESNGTATVVVQYFNTTGFQYQLNSTSSTGWIQQNTSPFTIPSLPVGQTTINIRYADGSACTKSLTVNITEPALLVATGAPTQATCNVPAKITATAIGGTAPYQYQLESPLGTVVTLYPYQSSNVFNPVDVGQTYFVRIKDFNGCIAVSAPIIINTIPLPTAIIATTSDLCYDGTNGATICVTASGGLPPYQYAFEAPYNYDNPNCKPVLPGTYIIKVRDANGCIFTLPPVTIAPQLSLNAVLTKDNDCSASPLAVITGTISQGTLPYRYQINNGPFIDMVPPSTGTTFTYSPATIANGTVKIKVTDANGCTIESQTINLTIPTAVTGSATPVATTCGLPNGTVTLAALTGTPPYSYSFNGSTLTTGLTTYPALAAASYPYQIQDSKFCITNGTVIVPATSSLTGSASITTPYTCSGKGCITIVASGGTTPYEYNLGTGFGSANVFCNRTNGTYTPVIKDASGCTLTLPVITIAALNPPTDIAFSNTAPNCPSQTANVTLSPVATNPIITYQIISPAVSAVSQSTNVFNNLAVGTYTFKITDDKLCSYTESYTILPVTPISVVGQVVKNVQCFNTATGEIKFTVAGFSPSFNYTINTVPVTNVTNYSSSTIILASQPAGSYTITVTDNTTSCTATATVVIAGPPSLLTLTKVVVAKSCSADGSVTITAAGGWGSYTYALTGPAGVVTPFSPGVYPALSAVGTYNITVTDGNGCVIPDSFNITAPVAPVLTLDPTVNLCYDGSNGVNITVNPATGGIPPYRYYIDNNINSPSNSNIFVNQLPGSHIIKVIDVNNCETALPAPVDIAQQLSASSVLTKGLDCSASPNAVYTFTVSGGTAPYSYQVNYNLTGFLPGTPTTIASSTLAYTLANGAGTYVLKFTDAKGCTYTTGTITLLPLVPVTATNTVTNVVCNGSSTGAVTIIPAGGSGQGYQVKFDTSLVFLNNLTYSGLVAGTYNYVVQDSNFCTVNGSVTISNLNTPIVATVSHTDIQYPTGNCADAPTQNGVISITGLSGGVGPYQITIANPGGTTIIEPIVLGPNFDFTGLEWGDYIVTIVDVNNCSIVDNEEIKVPPSGLGINTSVGQVSCVSGAEITISLSGPNFPSGNFYRYALYIPSGLPLPQPQFLTIPLAPTGTYTGLEGITYTFTGLAPNTLYTFVVYSTLSNCYYFQRATTGVSALSNLVLSSVVVNNVSCIGSADASVNFTVSNYAATSVSYQVYTSLVQPIGTIVTQTGLTGAPFTVSNLGPIPPGNYFVLFTINDGVNAGCTKGSTAFTVAQSATPLEFNLPTIKSAACGQKIGAILAPTSGGAGNNLYQIFTSAVAGTLAPYAAIGSPGYAAYQAFLATFTPAMTSFAFTQLAAGTYVIYVKDANGCVKSITVVVPTEVVPLLVPLTVASNQCTLPVPATGYTFTATISQGVGTMTYSLSPAQGNPDNNTGIFNVPASSTTVTYTVKVTDPNGCSDTTTIVIYPPLNVSASITAQASCPSNTGSIKAPAIGGNGTYVYTIDSVPTGAVLTGVVLTGNVFSNVPFGTYIIIAVSGGCSDTTTITLIKPADVTFTTVIAPVSCNGGAADGSITVNLTGTGNINIPYTYQLDGLPLLGQTSNLFTGVAAGTHTVTVTSALGCFTTANVVVGQPALPLVVTAALSPFTCAANNTINSTIVTLTGAGGTVGTGYLFSDSGTAGSYSSFNTFPVIDLGTGLPQTFTGYIKDSKGCLSQVSIIINPFPKITSVTFVATGTPINCTTNTQTVDVTASGGSGNYEYSRLPVVLIPSSYQALNTFTLTAPGNYDFIARDINTGCTKTATYNVAPFNTIDVVATAQPPVSCFGALNGLSFNVTGYTGAYTYKVYLGAVNPTNLQTSGSGNTTTNPTVLASTYAAGSYTIVVIETAAPFCVKTSNVITLSGPPTQLALQLVSNINANCTAPNALVIVNATGGTAPYSYAAVASILPIPTIGFSNLQPIPLNPATSTWYIYVKDANDCIITTPLTVPVVKDAPPVILPITSTANICDFTATSYAFTMNATGLAPLEYSYNGSAFSTDNTGSVPIPTTGITSIVISVKDKNGCVTTSTVLTSFILYPALGIASSIISQPTCLDNPLDPPTGEVKISISGGSGSANQVLTIIPAATLNASNDGFEGLTFAVPYTVTLTDNITGCTRTTTFTLATPQPVTLGSFTKTDVTCSGGTNGSFTVLLAPTTATINNNQQYLYQITAGPSIRPNQASPFFDNLGAGTYTVLITSGLNCKNTQQITITEPSAIVVPTPTVVNASCATANVSSFAVITCGLPNGGTGAYTYTFFEGANQLQSGNLTTCIVTNPLGGTNYTVKVTDVNGCFGVSGPVTIAPYIEITAVNLAVTKKITCLTGENILVTTTTIPAGAIPPLSYTVAAFAPVVYNQTNSTGIFTNLPIGSYNVSVRNTFTNCVILGAVHYVTDPNTFILSIPVANIVNVACNGGNTGSAQITIVDTVPLPTNDAGAFSYVIKDSLNATVQSGNSPTAGPVTISGLSAGVYTAIATLTDPLGTECQAQLNFTITQPAAPVTVTAVESGNVTCTNDQGAISVVIAGGTAPYTTTIVNQLSVVQASLTGLAAGTYTITVTDANGTTGGCTAVATVTLVRPITISGTAVQVNTILCKGDKTATINVINVLGGHVGPPNYYSYTLLKDGSRFDGPQTPTLFTGLGAGIYSVKITDDYNCDYTTPVITILEPTIVVPLLDTFAAIDCVSDAILTISASGGTPPYSYSTTIGGTYTPFAIAAPTRITVAPNATYNYYVKDANGCVSAQSGDIVIPIRPIIKVTVKEIQDNVCFGESSGAILVIASGGVNSDYTYTITPDPSVGSNTNTTGDFKYLKAGTYSITVTSLGGCSTTLSNIPVAEPLKFIVNLVFKNITCKGKKDGQLFITTQNSVGIVQYTLTPGEPSATKLLTYDPISNVPLPLTGLEPGKLYTILVQDESGCGVPSTFTLSEPTALDNDATEIISQEYCSGTNGGSFRVKIKTFINGAGNLQGTGTENYFVSLDDNSPTAVYVPLNEPLTYSHLYAGLAGGNHTVYVKDANGCEIQIPVALDPAIVINAKLNVDYICKDAVANPLNHINKLTVTLNPALAGITTYSLDGTGAYQTDPFFYDVTPGPHFVNVRNEIAYTSPTRTSICIKPTDTKTVRFVDPIVMNLVDGNLNEIIAVTSGGTAPYNYDFNGVNTGTTNTYIFTKTDNYFVTVKDFSGCALTVSRQFNFIDIYIPNFFTPDGNGDNDGWGPTNTYNYKNLVFYIFDRYGRKVGSFIEGQFWDGKYDGMDLPSGDYWYLIKADGENSEREFVGNFTLYR